MSLDVTLLRLLKNRENYERLNSHVPEGVDGRTRIILKDFGAYFKANPGAKQIAAPEFQSYFLLAHPKLNSEQQAVYAATIKEIAKDPEPGTADGILERLVSVATASKMQAILEGFDAGDVDLTPALRAVAERHETWMNRQVAHPKVKDRIEDILKEDENDTGLHWRLNCLNEAMRPLRGGDFGIVGARVDVGKSSFFASELSFMAPQVDTIWTGQNRDIVVFNNEGPGKRLKHRYYNAVLQADTAQLIEWMNDGSLYTRYVEAQGGRDLFKVYDIHDYTMTQLEDIVKEDRPALIVVDMLDNVTCDLGATNGGTRTDQLLEALYQRARIWAVKYDCIVIATSQLSAEADGEPFPTLAMLSNSKTGKPGAADFVINIGRSYSDGLENTRFIGAPKNKLRRQGGKGDPRKEVFFHAAKALYTD